MADTPAPGDSNTTPELVWEFGAESSSGLGVFLPEAPAQEPLSHLDGFEILELLGQGAAGAVYLARHPELGREVALKVMINPGEGVAALRFLQEARALARLHHPNVVTVHALHEGPPLVLVLERIQDGRSVKDLLRTGPLNPRRAAEITAAVAGALHAAHSAGVLHRDVKPANILIDPDGRPLLADFGLAKFVDGSTLRTQTGVLLGTPAYMPPEQFFREPGWERPAVDVYALGATLYELLTGRLPVEGHSLISLAARLSRSTLRPPEEINSQVPAALSAICMRCLRVKPEARYPSAAELELDLRKFLQARQEVPSSTAPPPWIAALVAGSALLVGAVALSMEPPGPPPALQRPLPTVAAVDPEAEFSAGWSALLTAGAEGAAAPELLLARARALGDIEVPPARQAQLKARALAASAQTWGRALQGAVARGAEEQVLHRLAVLACAAPAGRPGTEFEEVLREGLRPLERADADAFDVTTLVRTNELPPSTRRLVRAEEQLVSMGLRCSPALRARLEGLTSIIRQTRRPRLVLASLRLGANLHGSYAYETVASGSGAPLAPPGKSQAERFVALARSLPAPTAIVELTKPERARCARLARLTLDAPEADLAPLYRAELALLAFRLGAAPVSVLQGWDAALRCDPKLLLELYTWRAGERGGEAGYWEEAATALRAAKAGNPESDLYLGKPEALAKALETQARLLTRDGKSAAALRCYEEATHMLEGTREDNLAFLTRAGMSRLHRGAGAFERAERALAPLSGRRYLPSAFARELVLVPYERGDTTTARTRLSTLEVRCPEVFHELSPKIRGTH